MVTWHIAWFRTAPQPYRQDPLHHMGSNIVTKLFRRCFDSASHHWYCRIFVVRLVAAVTWGSDRFFLGPKSTRSVHLSHTIIHHCAPSYRHRIPIVHHPTPILHLRTPIVRPPSYSHRTPIVHPSYTIVLPWYSHHTPIVLPSYIHPTPLYSHCTPIVLPLYSHRTPIQTIAYQFWGGGSFGGFLGTS